MTDRNEWCHETRLGERGNAAIIVLVVLVVAAVGVLAYMSGKKGMLIKEDDQKVASAEDSANQGKTEAETQAEKDPNPVMAKLGDEEIRRQDVIDLINSMGPQMRQIPLEQLFPMALEQLINNKIIDRKAAKAGLEDNEDVQEQLAQAKQQIIRAKFLELKVDEKITEERLKEEYEDYLANFPKTEEVKAAHILVEEKSKAENIIKKLNEGASFEELAQEHSKDGTAENGGDLGYFSKEDVVPEFAEAAFGVEEGAYTKTPVKTEFGYHVIKVEEKRARPPADYAQIKPYIKQELRRSVLEEMVDAWKADYKLKRFDIEGNPLEEQEPAAGSQDPVQEGENAEETKATGGNESGDEAGSGEDKKNSAQETAE